MHRLFKEAGVSTDKILFRDSQMDMTLEDFHVVLENLTPAELKRILFVSGTYEDLFRVLDVNKDGYVHPWEMWQKLHEVNVEPEK